MYYRHVAGMPRPSNMLLLTKSDAEFVAEQLNAKDPDHYYEADCRFLGYEGYDGGVTMSLCETFHGKKYKRNYMKWVSPEEERRICKDRPIVPQSESHL